MRSGSGAQEENLFRRTNLSSTLTDCQPGLYPIREDEAVVCRGVTVFRGPESEGCPMLRMPFQLDFVACPALYHPQLTPEGALGPEDEELPRKKLRLVFRSARRNGNYGVVLGPMGCGAWHNPPQHVARVMREEAERRTPSARGRRSRAPGRVPGSGPREPTSWCTGTARRTTPSFAASSGRNE